MPEIIEVKGVNTGDLCFHCRKSEYWWRVQIHTDKPDAVVNLCLCGECVLLGTDELVKPFLDKE